MKNQLKVLVKVKAFSCNYRDKGLILSRTRKCSEGSFNFIGSEYVGEVIEVGSEVTRLRIGDRVIINGNYPSSGVKGISPDSGIPTNYASMRYQIVNEAKLIRVPSEMPDEVAAAFSIGAQTTYSMIRRLNVTEGSNIIVTAAKSNTSLFSINALKKHNVNVYVTTTSTQFDKELREMGVKEILYIESKLSSFSHHKFIKNIVSKTGKFDCIIDPFFDLHSGKLIDLMNYGAKYITCGLYDQHTFLTGKDFHYKGKELKDIMVDTFVKSIQIIGNCLGQTEDLLNAVKDYTSGSFNVNIDSVFKESQISAFFERTYNVKDRFGKVVYQYN